MYSKKICSNSSRNGLFWSWHQLVTSQSRYTNT